MAEDGQNKSISKSV